MTAGPTPATARGALRGVRPAGEDDRTTVTAYAHAVWSLLAEPGDGAAGRMVRGLGAAEALSVVTCGAAQAPAAAGMSAAELARGRERWLPRLSARALDAPLAAARAARVRLLVPGDAEWPAQLEDLGDHAPVCLWVRGRLDALRCAPSVAVVGARAATSYGEHVAMELAADLAGRGITVVSGGAYGVDGAAHRAALSAGGTTVALSAGGVERPYPAGNATLFERVAATGAIVAEVPCTAAPTKWRFLARNRLIAALAQASVVVEAGWRSGSLNTAGHAAALGRALGAVPGPITSAASAGTHRLMREYGAECITGADDVLELLGLGAPDRGGSVGSAAGPEGVRVRDALSTRTPRSVQQIAVGSGLGASDVVAALGLLELEGAVRRSGEAWLLSVPGAG